MPERYTLTQAARAVGVTQRIFTMWLQDAGVATHKGEKAAGEDARAQYVTREQVGLLAAAHGRILPDDTSLAALAGQIGRMQGDIDALRRRVEALEASLPADDRPTNKLPRI